MLKIECRDHLREVFKYAREIGMVDDLKEGLRYLDAYCEHEPEERGKTRCYLYYDHAPYSFYFWMKLHRDYVRSPDMAEFDEDGYACWFNGGLIFHGAHDRGGDGGAPSFSVNLTPQSGWRVHT